MALKPQHRDAAHATPHYEREDPQGPRAGWSLRCKASGIFRPQPMGRRTSMPGACQRPSCQSHHPR
eukprot:970986-Pleurochrysis_carterae.AAC.1